jgi:hypothetical protein
VRSSEECERGRDVIEKIMRRKGGGGDISGENRRNGMWERRGEVNGGVGKGKLFGRRNKGRMRGRGGEKGD